MRRSKPNAPRAAWSRRAAFLLLVLLGLGFGAGGSAEGTATGDLFVVRIDGSINPASADYLIGAIEQAEDAKASALLIELDTPGGLVSATKDIIQAMLNSTVPTIVYVTPRGATATSAGTFITLAANVAAMMPGTSIGAAHPVSLFGGGGEKPSPAGEESETKGSEQDVVAQKIENYLAAYVESIAKERNRNVEWAIDAVRNSVAVTAEEALELKVIDLVASDRAELLALIDGREVELSGESVVLATAQARTVVVEKTLVQSIFDFLSDPNVATILLGIGALGLYLEFQAPGMIVPGVVGLCAFVLLGFALQILPFSWIGAMVLLLGIALLVAELFITSFGLLFAAGITCFLIGGTMVFDRPEVSDLTVDFWQVLFPIALALTFFGGVIAYSLGRSILAQPVSGVEEMIGLIGRCESVVSSASNTSEGGSEGLVRGKVFVRGEYWNCLSEESISAGDAVEVVALEGLTLRVKKA